MSLPDFDDEGDLPEGVHQATLEDVIARLGSSNNRRKKLATLLRHIHALASETGHLERFIIFGSFVTAKPEPRDVDIMLVMGDDFDATACDTNTSVLFDHRGETELGASIFWIRPALLLEPLDDFIAYWQTKRDGARRGIIEVIA